MKKLLCIVMAMIMMFSFSACTGSSDTDTDTDVTLGEAAEGVDVDLTVLSATMVYSEVYNMIMNPDEYLGKIVKMTGIFGVYEDTSTGNMYFAILIMDATACCTQGVEFILADASYPDDYPEVGETATVIGEFQTYDEYGTEYINLIDAYLV
ncbi:MAG: hypothetical protein R3Y27_03220 [Clostridia bacterium]